MSLPKGAYQALEDALGPQYVCDEPGVTSAYSYMWLIYSTHAQSGRYRPAAVVLPESTEDVQTIIKIANRYQFNYIPVGTNLLPPTIPAVLIPLSLTRSGWTKFLKLIRRTCTRWCSHMSPMRSCSPRR